MGTAEEGRLCWALGGIDVPLIANQIPSKEKIRDWLLSKYELYLIEQRKSAICHSSLPLLLTALESPKKRVTFR